MKKNKKDVKRVKRKIKRKSNLRNKSSVSPFTGDFMNNFCRVHGIPVFQEKWHNKK